MNDCVLDVSVSSTRRSRCDSPVILGSDSDADDNGLGVVAMVCAAATNAAAERNDKPAGDATARGGKPARVRTFCCSCCCCCCSSSCSCTCCWWCGTVPSMVQ